MTRDLNVHGKPDLHHWIERDGVPVLVTLEEFAEWDRSGARWIRTTEVAGAVRTVRVVTFFDGIDPMAGCGGPYTHPYRTGILLLPASALVYEVRNEDRYEAIATHEEFCTLVRTMRAWALEL